MSIVAVTHIVTQNTVLICTVYYIVHILKFKYVYVDV